MDKISIPEKFSNEIIYKVARRDIDLNGHMHNLYYLDLAYEVLPQDIYEKRPIKCRVDDFYDMYLKHTISKEDYYKMNYDACKLLKNKY